MALNPCRVARSHLSDHLDGEPLPLLGRVLVRVHLAICPPCQRFDRSLRATREALHALRDADVAPDEAGAGGPGSPEL